MSGRIVVSHEEFERIQDELERPAQVVPALLAQLSATREADQRTRLAGLLGRAR